MAIARESGAFSKLVSLGGVVQTNGRGREMYHAQVTIPAAGVCVLNNNPKRISAIIQNIGTVVHSICFDPNTISLYVYPGQSFQIDSDFPWTGEVFIYATGVVSTVQICEVSIQ